MTPLEQIDLPSITLGGKSYPVPEFVVRQSIPFYKRVKVVAGVDFSKPIGAFSDEQIDALYDVAYITMLGAEPKLTRAAFDELPITMRDIAGAMLVIYQQGGLIAKTAPAPGEAQAESPSTSTGS